MTRKYVRRKILVWPRPQYRARYEAMAEKFKSGLTLQQIGDEFGITRERVRQILERLGVNRFEGGNYLRAHFNLQERLDRRDERYIRRTGMPFLEYWSIPSRARKAYQRHRENSRKRNIPFLFTFAEWWGLWQKSGKWAQRGTSGYVMCRKGDTGPYSANNIYIATCRKNIQDYHARRRQEAA